MREAGIVKSGIKLGRCFRLLVSSPLGLRSLLFYLFLGLLFGFAAVSVNVYLAFFLALFFASGFLLLLPGKKQALHWLLLVFLAGLPLCSLGFMPGIQQYSAYVPTLFTFVFGLLLLILLFDRAPVYRIVSPVTLPFAASAVLYVAALFLSILVAADQPLSLALSMRALMVLLVFFGLLGAVAWRTRVVESLLWMLSALGVVFGLGALATAFLGDIGVGPFVLQVYEHFYEAGLPRVGSIFYNPNSLGIFLLYSLASTVMLAFAMLCRRPFKHQNLLYPAVYALIGLQLLGLLFTFSRSSFLALAVFVALFLFFNWRRMFYLGLVLMVPAVVWMQARFADVLQEFLRISRLLAGRENMWSDGVELFMQSPLLGIGLGGWQAVTDWGVSVHNSYLRMAMELGVVGLAAYLGMLFSLLFLMLYRINKIEPATPRFVFLTGIFSLVIGLMLVKIFEVFFIGGTSFLDIYFVFILTLGLSLSRRRKEGEEKGEEKGKDVVLNSEVGGF